MEVRALARSDAAVAEVMGLGAEPVRGDLDNAAALRSGMRDCAAVFHSAAIVDDWGDPAVFHRVNVVGTENALIAAREVGVPRFVHVSTEAVLAGPAPLVRVDETMPKPANPYGPYARTKGLAEDRVLAANAGTLTTTIVRPRFVWGHGDTSVLPRVMAAVRSGRFRWIDGGRYLTSATHVRNVCEGLVRAAERGRGGEIYFVTDGPPLEFRTFLGSMLDTQGLRPSNRSIPAGVARTIAAATERIWTLLHRTSSPPVTRMAVKMMGEEVTIDDGKARRELGYSAQVTFDEGIREMRDRAPHPDGR
jgi:nucleoside-diphosphate-sugar epimerase